MSSTQLKIKFKYKNSRQLHTPDIMATKKMMKSDLAPLPPKRIAGNHKSTKLSQLLKFQYILQKGKTAEIPTNYFPKLDRNSPWAILNIKLQNTDLSYSGL